MFQKKKHHLTITVSQYVSLLSKIVQFYNEQFLKLGKGVSNLNCFSFSVRNLHNGKSVIQTSSKRKYKFKKKKETASKLVWVQPYTTYSYDLLGYFTYSSSQSIYSPLHEDFLHGKPLPIITQNCSAAFKRKTYS